MIIYEGEIETGDYYTPEYQIGIYSDLECAKSEVEKQSQFDETLRVYILELQDKEFVEVEVWEKVKRFDNPEWKKSTHP